MGHIRYKTKNVDNEFRFLDSLSNIEWGKYKKQKFSTNRGLNIFVETDGNKWKASVEKFPNRRGKDASGRNIFSVIEAEGIWGDDEAQKIFKLISFILLKDNTMEQCGEILDKIFDEDFVNQAFETDKTEEIAKKLNKFLDEIPTTMDFPENVVLKYQFAEVVEFTDESVRKFLNGVSRITKEYTNYNHHCIFAVNDLPYGENDLEIIADEIEDIDKIVILTKALSRISVPISDIKKKATTKPSLVMTESRPKSGSGSTKALRIVLPFLIISLIANLVTLTRGNYLNSTKKAEMESLILSKDSLIQLQNCLIKNQETLITVTKTELDSLKSMTNYIDNVNGNIVKLDIAEFRKSGACKLSVLKIDTTKQILFDTVTINSSVDFDKQKKCYVKLYRNSETRPFDEKHHPPFDIRSFCKTANKAKRPSRK